MRDPSLSQVKTPRTRGFVALILHAHLPWVRHPECNFFLEESWLYEAITETYVPLVEMLERLAAERVPHRMTLSLSPTLLNMLDDRLLRARYVRHLESRIELAEREIVRTRHDPPFHALAARYHESFTHALAAFSGRWRGDLIGAIARLADAGGLHLMTTTATHAVLPLLAVNEQAVRVQVRLGVSEFRRFFEREPSGMWLPECAYSVGLDHVLARAGIRFCCVDAHAIELASAPAAFGVYAPLYTPAGLAAFGRDPDSSAQVWSATQGYPGDHDYRDFYRDIGFDLEYEQVRPFLPPTGERVATGLKYYRITGSGDHKEPYDPARAQAKAATHAAHFVAERRHQIARLAPTFDRPPLITTPFDAELFGHWWYEGPHWLDSLCRMIAAEPTMRMITPGEYLDLFPTQQMAEPNASTWGWKGHHEVWLSGANDWIYRHLHHSADRMVALARRFPQAEGLRRRALDQAARELLLAQGSDWAFMMSRGTAVEYATKRTRDHLERFQRLAHDVTEGSIDAAWLASLEASDSLFPAIDYRLYA